MPMTRTPRPLDLTASQSRHLQQHKRILIVLPCRIPHIGRHWRTGWLYHGVEPEKQRWGVYNPVTDETIESPYQPGDAVPCREPIRYSVEHDNYYYVADSKGCGTLAYIQMSGIAKRDISARRIPDCAIRHRPVVESVECRRLNSITAAEAKLAGVSVLPLQSEDDPSAWYETSPGNNQARTPIGSFAADWNRRHKRPGDAFEVAWGFFNLLRMEK